MKPIVAVSIVLCLGLTACTSSDEPTTPGKAPEPLAAPAVAEKQMVEAGKVFAASQKAYERAQKACKGCPDAKLCQQALTQALQLTTAALQAGTMDTEDSGERAKEADGLVAQFDGLAELSNECL